jgi:hypothetical protein
VKSPQYGKAGILIFMIAVTDISIIKHDEI